MTAGDDLECIFERMVRPSFHPSLKSQTRGPCVAIVTITEPSSIATAGFPSTTHGGPSGSPVVASQRRLRPVYGSLVKTRIPLGLTAAPCEVYGLKSSCPPAGIGGASRRPVSASQRLVESVEIVITVRPFAA